MSEERRKKNGAGKSLDTLLKGRLALSIALTGLLFIAEVVGGYLTNSLALMSDAAHVFMDVLALSLSLFAIHISELPPTEKRTFGLYKAYTRIIDPQPVASLGMLAVAVVGLAVNIAVAFWLRHYARSDLNIKSAFLHVLGDAAASVAVIIASLVIHFTGLYLIDPLMSVLIGVIIVAGVSGI